jgi:hypothetical protein
MTFMVSPRDPFAAVIYEGHDEELSTLETSDNRHQRQAVAGDERRESPTNEGIYPNGVRAFMTFMVSPRDPFAAVIYEGMKKNSLRSRHRTTVTRDRQWLAMSVAESRDT